MDINNKYHIELVLLLPFLTNHDQLSVNYDLLNYCYYVVAPAKLALKRCSRKKELSSSKSRFSYIDILFFCCGFTGESRAELQGNGDASTAAATSLARGCFEPSSRLVLVTSTVLWSLLLILSSHYQPCCH